NQHRQDGLHRQIAFGTFARLHVFLSAEFLHGEPQRLADDFRGFDDADDARHGDTADAEWTAVVEKEFFGRHVPHGLKNAFAYGQRHAGREIADERDEHEPDGERTGADERGVLEAHDIAQTEHGRPRIHLEHYFEFIGYQFAPSA